MTNDKSMLCSVSPQGFPVLSVGLCLGACALTLPAQPFTDSWACFLTVAVKGKFPVSHRAGMPARPFLVKGPIQEKRCVYGLQLFPIPK